MPEISECIGGEKMLLSAANTPLRVLDAGLIIPDAAGSIN